MRARLEDASASTLGDLRRELAEARSAAGDLLEVDLVYVADAAPPVPLALPLLDDSISRGWEELVSSTFARRLPAGLRRRRVRRDLEQWIGAGMTRPYGQARSALQRELEASTRLLARAVDEEWGRRLAALERGVAAAGDRLDHAEEQAARLVALDDRDRELKATLTLLGK